MDDLIDLGILLDDIAETIDLAERLAGEVSGERGGRDPIDTILDEPCPECHGAGVRRKDWDFKPGGLPPYCPACNGKGTYQSRYTDPGEPAVEGWPAFVRLAGALGSMAETLRVARAGEVDDAIRAAHEEAMDAPEPIAPGDR